MAQRQRLPLIAVSMSASVGRGVRRSSAAGGHDLPRLAVAALRHVELFPRALQRMRAVGRESLERGDRGSLPPPTRASGTSATALPSQVHGARAALAEAAAELRAAQVEHVAQHPEQRHIGRNINRHRLSVDVERERHGDASSQADSTGRTRGTPGGIRSRLGARKKAPSVTTVSPGWRPLEMATWSPIVSPTVTSRWTKRPGLVETYTTDCAPTVCTRRLRHHDDRARRPRADADVDEHAEPQPIAGVGHLGAELRRSRLRLHLRIDVIDAPAQLHARVGGAS